MEYIDYIMIAALAAYVGHKVTEWFYLWTFRGMMEQMGVTSNDLRKILDKMQREVAGDAPDDIEDSDLEVVSVVIEKHNDTLYCFQKDTDKFLGQGSSKEELIKRLGEKLSNVKLNIAEADGAEHIGGSYFFDLSTKEVKPNE